jgi:hypothetical protein
MKLSTYLLTALAVATTTSAWRVKFTGFMESTKDDHTQELQCHGKDKSKHLDKCFKLIPKYSQKTSHIEFLNDNDKLRLIAYDDDRCGGTVVADVKPSDFDLKLHDHQEKAEAEDPGAAEKGSRGRGEEMQELGMWFFLIGHSPRELQFAVKGRREFFLSCTCLRIMTVHNTVHLALGLWKA